MKKFIAIAVALAALIWVMWLFAVPAPLVESVVEDNLKSGALNADVVGFRKGLFMSFTAKGMDISAAGEKLVTIDDISARFSPSGLFRLKALVPFEGVLGGGSLRGRVELGRESYGTEVRINKVQIERLGLLERAGMTGRGILTAEFHAKDGRGDLRFSITDMHLEKVPFFGDSAGIFNDVKGIIRFDGDRVEVESVSLEGEGIYARAKGSIKGGKADIKIAVMPEEGLALDPDLYSLLQSYLVSPGYYVIAVRSDIRYLFAYR